jgi:hypothetical protein
LEATPRLIRRTQPTVQEDVIMARSNHAVYTAADRFERKANRRKRPTSKRTNTRHAAIAAAILEA